MRRQAGDGGSLLQRNVQCQCRDQADQHLLGIARETLLAHFDTVPTRSEPDVQPVRCRGTRPALTIDEHFGVGWDYANGQCPELRLWRLALHTAIGSTISVKIDSRWIGLQGPSKRIS